MPENKYDFQRYRWDQLGKTQQGLWDQVISVNANKDKTGG